MVTLVEREQSDEFRLSPPPPSAEIEATYQSFENLGGVEVEKMRAEAREIVKVVFDFADYKDANDKPEKKGLISSAYEAAYLMPIMKKLSSTNPVEKDAAERAILSYHSKFSTSSEYVQDRNYVRAISRDIVEIDTFLDTQFEQRELDLPDEEEGVPTVRQYQNPYLKTYKKKPFEDALELIADHSEEGVTNPKGVNLESVVLSAASAYYDLRHSDDLHFPEDEVLKTIYAAETFYEPALDIISYGAFGSMAFKREVSLIRLSRNGGHYGDLDYEKLGIAREELAKLPSPERMPGVIANLIAKLTGKHAEASSVLRDTSDHGVQFIAGSVDYTTSDRPDHDEDFSDIEEDDIDIDEGRIAIRSRVQTDVKYAGKITVTRELDEHGKEVLKVKKGADLVGITLIVSDVQLLLDVYQRVVGMASEFDSRSSKVVPKQSRSKNTPLHVAGSELIKLAEKEFGGLFGDIDKRETKNGYQAAKITLLYTPEGMQDAMPVEIAFQTTSDRFEARVGKASHAFQDDNRNYDVTPARLRVSRGLHIRRLRLNRPGLTTLSELRGGDFYREIENSDKDIQSKRVGDIGLRAAATPAE